MPSDPSQPARFTLQSVFAVNGNSVLMGSVISGTVVSGMTTTVAGKKCTVVKVEGTQDNAITKPVVGITLSGIKPEDLQTMSSGEFIFLPSGKTS